MRGANIPSSYYFFFPSKLGRDGEVGCGKWGFGLEVGDLVGIGEVDGEFEWRMAFVMWESLGSCLFRKGDGWYRGEGAEGWPREVRGIWGVWYVVVWGGKGWREVDGGAGRCW